MPFARPSTKTLLLIVGVVLLSSLSAASGFLWGRRYADRKIADWAYNLGYSSGVSDATTPGATLIDVSTGKTTVVPGKAE